MRSFLICIILLTEFVQAQQTAQVERFWLKPNTHSTVKSLQFYRLDSLITNDSSQMHFRILPDFQFAVNSYSNNTGEFKLQTGLNFSIEGNYRQKISYMFDLRSGISNQSILPYNSTFQNKSMFYKDLDLENQYQDYAFYGDLRGRILYKPTKALLDFGIAGFSTACSTKYSSFISTTPNCLGSSTFLTPNIL